MPMKETKRITVQPSFMVVEDKMPGDMVPLPEDSPQKDMPKPPAAKPAPPLAEPKPLNVLKPGPVHPKTPPVVSDSDSETDDESIHGSDLDSEAEDDIKRILGDAKTRLEAEANASAEFEKLDTDKNGHIDA